jgi:hypothetical protein
MPTIEESLNNQGFSENEYQETTAPQVEPVVEGESGFRLDLSWLSTPTGEGSVEDYMEHPLNFMKSKGIAQILRGLTGFFGNLKLALIDVALGALQFIKERRA